MMSRLDRIVMPLLMLAFFALQLDRGNMYGPLARDSSSDIG